MWLLASSCPSVRLSVCPSFRVKQPGSHWTDFDEISYLSSKKSLEKVQFSFNFDDNTGYFTWRRFHIYDSILLEWKMFQIKVVQKTKIHILRPIIFFSENRAICEIMSKMWRNQKRFKWKYGGTFHAGLVMLHAQAQARAHAPTDIHVRTHTRTRTHTHTQKDVIIIAFTRQQWFHGTLLNATLCAHCLFRFSVLLSETFFVPINT
jgi:hypothetical protein